MEIGEYSYGRTSADQRFRIHQCHKPDKKGGADPAVIKASTSMKHNLVRMSAGNSEDMQ
jgi:hypothetical protein